MSRELVRLIPLGRGKRRISEEQCEFRVVDRDSPLRITMSKPLTQDELDQPLESYQLTERPTIEHLTCEWVTLRGGKSSQADCFSDVALVADHAE